MKTFRTCITLEMMLLMFSFTLAHAGDIDRTKRPEGKPVPAVHLPDIQKKTLSNGLQVWLVEHHSLPTVAFNLVIQTGSDHDPLTMPGLASMTADVLDEGTSTRSALEISDAIESIGASFSTSADIDGSNIRLTTLKKHLDRALDVFADVLTHPAFAQKDFERVRKQRIGLLLQQRDRAVTIANNAYSYILYGANHPYGMNASGTEASLNAMTTDDLKKFYSTYYRPSNATLIVVGDAKLDEIISALEKKTSDWKSAPVPEFTVAQPAMVDTRKVYLIDKPGAPQSEVRIGYPAAARSTPDYFPLRVMNQLLGGQFTSRINLNIREKHGYTYGARSAFSFQKGIGPFTASGGIVTEKTDSALKEFLFEIDRMKADGMTAEELAFVKKGLVGGFALSFETPAQIANALQSLVLYGLPDNYFQNFLKQIDGVTLSDVSTVSKKYLDSSRMAVVVVGDLSRIQDGITKMNFGDIVMCDVDGKPLK